MPVNLNFDRIIFVIDSPLIAMIVAIIAQKNPINVIYEFKNGVDNPRKVECALNDILSNTNISQKQIFNVPSPYFLINKKHPFDSIIRILRFQKAINAIPLDSDLYYCGPITSSIMSRVPLDHTITIDHGSGEYAKRMHQNKSKTFKRLIYEKIAAVLNLYSLNRDVSSRGFTLCEMSNDVYTHIDYRNYVIPDVIFNALIEVKKKISVYSEITLAFPFATLHGVNGFDSDNTKYNLINANMINKYCKLTEFVIIKFHPSLYSVENPNITLLDCLKKAGYNCINIDPLLPFHLQGNLPAEIIVKFFNVKKIVAELSATMFNLAHNDSIVNYAAAKDFDCVFKRDGYFIKHTQEINQYLRNKVIL